MSGDAPNLKLVGSGELPKLRSQTEQAKNKLRQQIAEQIQRLRNVVSIADLMELETIHTTLEVLTTRGERYR